MAQVQPARIQGVIVGTFLFEVDAPYEIPSRNKLIDSISTAVGRLHHIIVALEFQDEDGDRLRKTEFGEMSPAMIRLMAKEFADDPPDQVGA
jgi:O-methyltransferase involved in polyketide biosynthesis